MVEINITILVQMLHFVVMWKFLDRFFFQDVVKSIQKQESVVKRLDKAVEKERSLIHSEQEKQADIWKAYRKKFGKSAPLVEAVPDLAYSSVLCPVTLSLTKDQKTRLVKEASQLVVKRMLDDQ